MLLKVLLDPSVELLFAVFMNLIIDLSFFKKSSIINLIKLLTPILDITQSEKWNVFHSIQKSINSIPSKLQSLSYHLPYPIIRHLILRNKHSHPTPTGTLSSTFDEKRTLTTVKESSLTENWSKGWMKLAQISTVMIFSLPVKQGPPSDPYRNAL